mmetsp:Transcript_44518/g.143310  ORF Transcript_44518/g.143310 Transcript_44518/m.143310 type:complete len:394 (+) Transcript_44518:70-1251(+)
MCMLSCACDKYKSNPRISGVCFSFSLRAFFRVGASSVTHQKAWQENGGDLALVSGHLSVRVVGEVPRLEVDPQEGAEPVEHVRLRLGARDAVSLPGVRVVLDGGASVSGPPERLHEGRNLLEGHVDVLVAVQDQDRSAQLGRPRDRRGLARSGGDLLLVHPAPHQRVIVVANLGVALLHVPVSDARHRDAAAEDALAADVLQQAHRRQVAAPRVPRHSHASRRVQPRLDLTRLGLEVLRASEAVGEVGDAAAVRHHAVHEAEAVAGRAREVGRQHKVAAGREPGEQRVVVERELAHRPAVQPEQRLQRAVALRRKAECVDGQRLAAAVRGRLVADHHLGRREQLALQRQRHRLGQPRLPPRGAAPPAAKAVGLRLARQPEVSPRRGAPVVVDD